MCQARETDKITESEPGPVWSENRTGLDKTSGAQQMRCGHLSRCLPAFETCVADRLGAVGEKGENVWTKTQQLTARDDKMGRPEK